MVAVAFEIVGRGPELAAIGRLLEASGPRAVVIEGEAGLGKSTLWRSGVAAAHAAGSTVLVARPAEGERLLPYAALGDLVDPVLDCHLSSLPEVQRRALDTALLRGASGEPAESLAVARAMLGLLRGAGVHGGVLLAIDDVQWLDAPTTRALEFVARRLPSDALRLLVARRTARPESPPLGLDRGPAGASLVTLRLGPFDTTSLDVLLRTRLDLRLTRPLLSRLGRITGGNPYYALEIAPTLAAGEELSIPSSLTAALAERVGGLSPPVRDAVLLAAASVRPTPDLVELAAGSREGLAGALDLGLVETTARRLRFTHPCSPRSPTDGRFRASGAMRTAASLRRRPTRRSGRSTSPAAPSGPTRLWLASSKK